MYALTALSKKSRLQVGQRGLSLKNNVAEVGRFVCT